MPISTILKTYSKIQAEKLEKNIFDPREAQEQALRKIIQRAGSSELGVRVGLDRVSTLDDAKKLPITDAQFIVRELNQVWEEGVGASSIFGKSKVVAFAESSGTTGIPKRMPLNQDYFAAYRRFMMRMQTYLLSRVEDPTWLTHGKSLSIASSNHLRNSPGGLPIGFISGIMAARVPWFLRHKILPSDKILSIPSWDDKICAMVEEARHHDVRSINGIPALTLAFLEKALEILKVRTLRDVWPNLRGYAFGGTGVLPAERKRFLEIFGVEDPKDFIFWETYGATEGQFGHSREFFESGLVFHPIEIFYQFLEEDGKPLLQLHELKTGGRYSVLVTTPGGLINYRMKDWIEVISENPLTYRVAGREQEEISVATEKISIGHVKMALEKSLERLGIPLGEFVVFVRRGKPHRLIWGLPFEVNDTGFIRVLDQALMEQNSVYKGCRGPIGVYGEPELISIPSEVFRKYRDRNLGKGQFKPKRLFQNQEEFEQVYDWTP